MASQPDKDKQISWKDWCPGLDNDDMTLEEVLETLPGNDQQEINMLVRMFENPASPVAFKGAITLARHDCVHIVLGRGLLPQDEAFVIGFTMGTSKKINRAEQMIFKLITRYLYPKIYRFTPQQLKIFDMALRLGVRSAARKIYDFPFEDHHDKTIGELREQLGIDKRALKAAFIREKNMIPGTKASKRLPI